MDRNKMKGMLWGLLVGDALGSPIQFTSKDGHEHITEMEPCPMFGVGAGCWTDDGSMALCVMDSYVRQGGYDLKDIGNTFVKWLDEGYLSSKEGEAFDQGNTTVYSLLDFKDGSLVNGSEDAQGNGSIMRFAPSYLIDRYGCGGDGVTALPGLNGTGLGRARHSVTAAPNAVMHAISDLTHASSRVRRVVDRFAAILDEHMAGRRTMAVSAYATREEVNNSGWAVSTLEAALWAFNTTKTFEEGMIAAVNLGGDSDTIGAVYGQLAGAYYGFDAIPARWVKAMKTPEKIEALIEQFLNRLDDGEATSSSLQNKEI